MDLGKTQLLKIAEKNYSGLFLEDENGERAFLPKIFASEDAEIGDEMEVFVYQDDDKLKATTEKANAEVGEFAVMTCVQSLPSGALSSQFLKMRRQAPASKPTATLWHAMQHSAKKPASCRWLSRKC